MMHCQVHDTECELAGELVIVNPNTEEQSVYTMCHAHHEGKLCQYDCLDKIIRLVCKQLKVTKKAMIKRGRKRNMVYARAVVCWLAYNYTDLPLTGIGKALGRDHCVAIYYINMVRDWINNPRLNPDTVKVINNV